jgi:uncharacterized protein (TIGR03437 family)
MTSRYLVQASLIFVFCVALPAQTTGYMIGMVAEVIRGALTSPAGLATDGSGNLYVADAGGSRVWKLSPQRTITAAAGTGSPGFSGDGGPATSAQLRGPSAVAIDASGNMYIADAGNHVIRKVTPSGTITTFAGNGMSGFAGDGGPAASAQLAVNGLAVDRTGNVYVSSGVVSSSALVNRVRKITPQGVITTVAGGGNASPDVVGAATSAALYLPMGLAVDTAGNLYIADAGYNTIRKVTPQGIISNVAGDGSPMVCCPAAFSGDGGLATTAQLDTPASVAVDSAGSLYIVDVGNYRVRRVNGQGIISTIAGGATGVSGNGLPATAVQLGFATPGGISSLGADYQGLLYGIAVASSGEVYFAATDGVKELMPTSSQVPSGCVYSIDQNTATVGASGMTANVGVLASASTCPWMAGTNVDWITVNPADVQMGTGVVSFTVSPNPDSAARTGNVWMAGQAVTVNQSGVTCTLTVGSRSVPVPPGGVTGTTLTVNTNARDCGWNAVASAAWILISAGANGAGSGSITYTVGVNTGAMRTGTIKVADQTIYINQAASGASISSLASLASGGIVNAATGAQPIASGGFVSVYGQNLADVILDWSSAIINGKLPTSLGGVQVLINGKSAFISYVQPTQINAIAQPDTANGAVEVDVVTNHGTVPGFVNMMPISPGLFTYATNGTVYADALFNSDGAYVGAVGAIPGVISRPAQAGDYIMLFATGLGTTNPAYPVGQVLNTAYPVPDVSQISVTIGGLPTNVLFAGITYPGLFQINVRVPSGIPPGDQTITLRYGSQASQANVFLTCGGA